MAMYQSQNKPASLVFPTTAIFLEVFACEEEENEEEE
jgi:hypothetical protein